MKTRLNATLLIAGAIGFSSAHATFMKADLFAPGDRLLIRDSVTQMEWVHLSVTEGIGVYNVKQGYKGLTTQLGFHLPTMGEASALLANANLPMRTETIAADRLAAIHFQELFGITVYWSEYYPGNQGVSSFGFVEQRGNVMQSGISAMGVSAGPVFGGSSWLSLTLRNNTYTNGHKDYASFLTRPYVPSTVPEPGSLVLLGVGMAGLGVTGWTARRKRPSAPRRRLF